MRDSRRTESDAASCSTAVVGEEPALRPAASRAVRSAARSLTDGEQSLTAESALSAEIESVDTDISTDAVADMPVAAADGDSAVPPPFLFGKPKRAPTGQSADAESAEGTATENNVEKLDVAEELQDRYMDNECGSGAYPSLAADPDFNALLEDIATGPLNGSASAAVSKPPAAPVAAAGSEAAAAAAAVPRKTPAKLKPNPLRGFLSRRLLSPQAPAAAEPPPTPKPATAADSPAPKSPQAEQQAQLQPQSPPQQQQQQEEPERAPSGDGSERAPEQEEKYVAQDERLQQQEEDSQDVLGLAMGWLQGMYSNGARESLPANAAFDRIAALLPGAPLCPHQLLHTLQVFICSFSTTC